MRHISPATNDTRKDLGFTLIEVLLAVILSSVVVTIFVAALFTMMSTAVLQKTQLELSQKNQLALDIIERDIRIATAFSTTLDYTTFVDNYGPSNTNEGWSGSWSYKGSDANHRVIILKETATTTPPLSILRTPVYIQGYVSNVYAATDLNMNCTAYNSVSAPLGALTYNAKLPYYLIYFVRDNNLYRRTLTDITTALCSSSQYQKQSCPAADTSPHANCRAHDELIAQNVASFDATYYSQDDQAATTDIDAYNSNSSVIFDDINNVLVTLKLQKAVNGGSPSSTLSVRVGRVN